MNGINVDVVFDVRTAIGCAVVAVLGVIFGLFAKKIPRPIAELCCLSAGILSCFLCGSVQAGKPVFGAETVCDGAVAYSLGTLLSATALKLFRGEKVTETEILSLIQQVTAGVCRAETARKIASLYDVIFTGDDNLAEERLKDILRANDRLSEEQLQLTAKTIVKACKGLKKN